MIKAEHKKWARLIFDPYINRYLKKHFSNFYTVNDFPNIPSGKGLLITPNHISWWDGFFIDFVCKRSLKRKIHLMMLEEQLSIYSFFKKLGAYSIIPGKIKSVKETAKYTREIINNTENLAVVYPQGEIEPFEKRPLIIKEGLKLFVNNIQRETLVMPVGFKIQYYNKKKPAVVVRFAEPLNAENIIDDFQQFEKSFTGNLDLLSQAAFKKEFISDLFK